MSNALETDMSTVCCATTIPLFRPWWARWADAARAWRADRRQRAAERDAYAGLAQLSEQTLRDIGAPDWLHARDRGAALRQARRDTW
jgi:hypothetical protein